MTTKAELETELEIIERDLREARDELLLYIGVEAYLLGAEYITQEQLEEAHYAVRERNDDS